MTLDRRLQSPPIVDGDRMRALPGLELPGHRSSDAISAHRHIVAWPEFVEVWLGKALLANASGVIPVLASQLFAAHLAQLGRALGATKLTLGPAHSAPAVAAARAIAPGPAIVPRALLEPCLSVDVTGDLLGLVHDVTYRPSSGDESWTGQRLLFRHGAPVWFAGATCTLGSVLARLGVSEGFESLVESKRRLEARRLSAEPLAAKRALDAEWSRVVATGGWYHPRRRELDRALRDIGRQVHGEVTLTPTVAKGTGVEICRPAVDDRQTVESRVAAC